MWNLMFSKKLIINFREDTRTSSWLLRRKQSGDLGLVYLFALSYLTIFAFDLFSLQFSKEITEMQSWLQMIHGRRGKHTPPKVGVRIRPPQNIRQKSVRSFFFPGGYSNKRIPDFLEKIQVRIPGLKNAWHILCNCQLQCAS